MTIAGLSVVLGIARLLGQLGFVLFAGVLLCWAVGAIPQPTLQPNARSSEPTTALPRPLVRLQRAGLIGLAVGALLSLAVVAGLLTGPGSGATLAPDLVGGGAIARLAILAGTTLLLSDLTRDPPTRARRIWALVIIGALALTLLSDGPTIRGTHWILTTWIGSWQLIGLAGVLGALAVIRTSTGTVGSALGSTAEPATDPTDRAGHSMMITLDRPALVVRLSSVVVGLAALIALVTGLTGALGPGYRWIVVAVGLLIMIGLALAGTRGLLRAPALRSSAVHWCTAALAVGGAVVIIAGLLPQPR